MRLQIQKWQGKATGFLSAEDLPLFVVSFGFRFCKTRTDKKGSLG